ncbi:hypothetical protein [Gilliamella sp. Bif1-4]|uniref:hypothetical protein n=1 Tax=Gilliamella sp. Bif1-4 TaxID=3120233 RepID=UPI00080DEEDC|nr:hypothetical protein [Gilliamella apicola]OCG41784.1 hypothetical protein A9G25_03315 [Gilliamella apicola]
MYSKLFFKSSSELFLKTPLSLMPLLLLPYSLESQALSATTSERIHGSAPYLIFDDGTTKLTTTDDLLSIKLSDGRTFTPQNNPSSPTNPIVLPAIGQSFADIGMLVPRSSNSISISGLVAQGKWGDDDGDGKEDSITASGDIRLSITDKNNQTVNRNEVLTICNAPYKVELSSTDGYLKTLYGVPDINTFTESRTTYYINPKSSPAICFVRPNLREGEDNFAGPVDIWNSDKGFLTQSATPLQYGRNFPTTGSDGLYFDLNISGVDSKQLTWDSVTRGGITATVIEKEIDWWESGISNEEKVTRVMLTGPKASDAQKQTDSPDPIPKPNLPQVFELEGKDSNKNVVVKYGFVLQKWFVHRGDSMNTYFNQTSWCNSVGYRVPQVRDLTNAVCSGLLESEECQGAIGAKPPSKNNMYQRQIGAGFYPEWGALYFYYRSPGESPPILYYSITSDTNESGLPFVVNNGGNGDGLIDLGLNLDWYSYNAICVTP